MDGVQWVHVLALMGDASDNVPGVPGVGAKGALSLIQQYGSVESVLENADKVTHTISSSPKWLSKMAAGHTTCPVASSTVPAGFLSWLAPSEEAVDNQWACKCIHSQTLSWPGERQTLDLLNVCHPLYKGSAQTLGHSQRMSVTNVGEKERAEGAAQQHGGDPEGTAQQEAGHHPDGPRSTTRQASIPCFRMSALKSLSLHVAYMNDCAPYNEIARPYRMQGPEMKLVAEKPLCNVQDTLGESLVESASRGALGRD